MLQYRCSMWASRERVVCYTTATVSDGGVPSVESIIEYKKLVEDNCPRTTLIPLSTNDGYSYVFNMAKLIFISNNVFAVFVITILLQSILCVQKWKIPKQHLWVGAITRNRQCDVILNAQ